MEKSNTLAFLSLFLLLQQKKALVPAIEEIPPVTHNTVTIEVPPICISPHWVVRYSALFRYLGLL